MAFNLGGLRLSHRKNTIKSQTLRIDLPDVITVPMSMHMGRPAKPVVKVGDSVKIGTKIGEADGRISACIHSGISGKVSGLKEYLLFEGSVATAVVIESDGKTAVDENVRPPVINSREDFVNAVRNSGVVGLGGAGFPTHVKLDVEEGKLQYLVVNGAECEPYITSDNVTMLTRTEDIRIALENISAWLGIKNVIFGIEKNKKDAISSIKAMAETIKTCNVTVTALPEIYPQGGEKVLVYRTTGRKIPQGKFPTDVGCAVLNCTTLASIGKFLRTGMPLVERCVTVDGSAVRNSCNVIVPVGTNLGDLFEFCGGFVSPAKKIIYGGPMMGISVPDLNYSVLKNTNAVLAFSEKEAYLPDSTPCIRCGKCINICPFGLSPVDFFEAYEKKDTQKLSELSVNTCMECGCCSYVCPASRPLVQVNKLSKQLLKEKTRNQEGKA